MTHLTQRLLLASIVAASALSSAASADDPAAVPKKPAKKRGPDFTISKATTHITKPLTKDGYVDYVAALNQQLSKGVTPDINAAVPLWEAIGTKPLEDWEPKHREQLFKMLGMKELKDGDKQYISGEDFVEKTEDTPTKRAEVNEKMSRDMDSAMSMPWSEVVYPELAAWVAANDAAIKSTVAASLRPRYYNPLVSMEPDFAMISVLLPIVGEVRNSARLLILRAMQSAAAGKTEVAWNEILACWRLGRLVGQGSTLVDSLVGIAIEGMAAEATVALVHHTKLSDEQIAAMRKDLAALPKRDKMIDKIDVAERYMFLDTMQTIERKRISSIKEFVEIVGFVNALSGILTLSDGDESKIGFSRAVKRLWIRMFIDWDFVMHDANRWYDRFVRVGRMPRGAEQDKAWELLESDYMKLRVQITDRETILTDILSGKTPRRIVSERISGTFVALLMPALSAALDAEHRADMYVEMVDTAFALKLYHNKHGKYPAKLDALVPKHLKSVLVDINNEKDQVRYKRTTAGYLLYSVGRDGKDQGGPALDDERITDDLGFRVPAAVSGK